MKPCLRVFLSSSEDLFQWLTVFFESLYGASSAETYPGTFRGAISRGWKNTVALGSLCSPQSSF